MTAEHSRKEEETSKPLKFSMLVHTSSTVTRLIFNFPRIVSDTHNLRSLDTDKCCSLNYFRRFLRKNRIDECVHKVFLSIEAKDCQTSAER